MSSTMNIPQIDYTQLSNKSMHLIDVRSPEEFEQFHLPGSINLPLLSNEERKEIGTMYKRISQEKAKERGLEIFAKKLPEYYRRLKQLEKQASERPFVFICSRGRMRSGVFAATMCSLGLHAFQLDGGMKSVWHHVQQRLKELSKIDWKGIVISGNTGTGKTYWLLKLKESGYPVIDLEGLAGHRGSIFGHIGLQPNSQKQFQFELVNQLEKYKDGKLLIIEAESKRIGKVIVPDFLLDLMEKSDVIELSDSLENRIERIINDYKPNDHYENFLEAYSIIRKRIPHQFQEEINKAFLEKNYRQAFLLLIQYYYDVRYEYSTSHLKKEKYVINIQHMCEEDVLETLEKYIQTLSYSK